MNPTKHPESLGQDHSVNLTERFGTVAPLGVPRSRRSIERERDANPETLLPKWLAEKVDESRRTAKAKTCPKCSADILVGPSDDDLYWTARVDLTPVDLVSEVVALLTGAKSYDLIRGRLHHRRDHHQGRPGGHPVHLDHVCTGSRINEEPSCLF